MIKKHRVDILQVAISIIEGRISPSFILRRLVVGLGKISFFMPLWGSGSERALAAK
jgi:hypothetical protein